MNSEKDCTQRGWLAAVMLIVVLIGVSFIPPHSIGGVSLRRASIFSDLFRFDDMPDAPSQVMLNEEEFRVDMTEVAQQVGAVDTLPQDIQTTFAWRIGAPRPTSQPNQLRFDDQAAEEIIPIENFDTTGSNPLRALCEKIIEGRSVRIAVLGDSFIEGDILTADLRERLQDLYGGAGAGFAPMASPLTGFRRTIKTQSKGWTPYNIMQHRTTPEALRDNYFISGWVCLPTAHAQTRWENTTTHRHLDPAYGARILFLSRRDSHVEAVVNDTLRRTFAVAGDPALRQIEIEGAPIHSLTFRVVEGADGVIGYGAVMEGEGINVDNYSVRSNNGQAMFRTSPTINAQANAMLEYDLVILQYGLNIMQQGIRNYANYGAQVRKMIAYIQECFPSTAILVLGVSDRSTRTETGFAPMDAVPYMTDCQRQAAMASHTAFWDTAAAMRAMGGMAHFVSNGWAGKDYTHINHAGGRRIAHALAKALHEAVRQAAKERQFEQYRQSMQQVVNDSLRHAVRQELISPVTIH